MTESFQPERPTDETMPLTGGSEADPLLDDVRLDRGIREAFAPEESSHGSDDAYKSVVDLIGADMGMVSRISLLEVDEEPGPVHAARTDSAELPPQIGRYRVAGEIARGGVGAVFQARDEDLGRDVALKVLLGDFRENTEMTQRFLDEAQVGGQLQHPGIVPVHEVGLFHGAHPFFAMKLVKGQTLARLLEERNDPSYDRLRFLGIFEQICQPLAYAHARGVIHRDLKPSNVMVGAFGEVQVMDWGLAKVLKRGGLADDRRGVKSEPNVSIIETGRSGNTGSKSLAGSVLGTPAYMPPEQARGEVDDLDERSDVFGLGAILCEILTGKPPYSGNSVREVHRQAQRGYLDDGFQRLDACQADPRLIAIAKRCLSVEPRDRYRDARALAQEVSAYLGALEEQARESEIRAARAEVKLAEARVSRRRTITFAAVLVVMGFLGTGGYLWIDGQRRNAEARVGQQKRQAAENASRLVEKELSRALLLRAEASMADEADVSSWTAALEAVQRAKRISHALSADLQSELEAAHSEIDRAVRLRRLLAALRVAQSAESHEDMDRKYWSAFRAFLPADPSELSATELASQLQSEAFRAEIALALDEWALVRLARQRPWKSIKDAALLLEQAPFRHTTWKFIERGDLNGLDATLASPELDAASPALLCLFAEWVASQGELDQAEHLLRRAVDLQPGSFQANLALGELLAREDVRRFEESILYLNVARALRPGSLRASKMLFLATASTGRADAALDLFWKIAIRDNFWAWNNREFWGRDDLQFSRGALEALAKELGESPPSTMFGQHIPHEVLKLLCQSGGGAQAERLAVSDVSMRTENQASALYTLASIQFERGRRVEAVRTLEEALASPNVPWTWGKDRWRDPRWDLIAFRQSVAPRIVSCASIDAALEQVVLLAPGEIWRYYSGEDAPSPGRRWARKDHVEEAWAEGKSPFGFGRLAHHGTILPDMRNRYSTAYFRRRFQVDDPSAFESVSLTVKAGNGFVAYLNGKFVGKARMPRNSTHDTLATPGLSPVEIDISSGIQPGENVLAVQVAKSAGASGIFWFDAQAIAKRRIDVESRARLAESLRPKLHASNAPALGAYLDGRLLELSGDFAGAATRYRAAIALDHRFAAPFSRLWESLRLSRDINAANSSLEEALEVGMPDSLLQIPPESPRCLEARRAGGLLRLRASTFRHIDPRVRHVASRWKVRTEDGDYERCPVIHSVSRDQLTEFKLDRDLLQPRTRYFWTVSYLGNAGKWKPGDEGSFETGDYVFEFESIDLTAQFNRDIVVSDVDDPGDTVDGGASLCIEGLRQDGFDHPLRGLPVNGVIGIHRLGDYRRPNALQFLATDTKAVRVEAPQRRYRALRFLVVGGWGETSIPVNFIYTDGSSEERTLVCDDWLDFPEFFESVWGGVTTGAQPLVDGMNVVGYSARSTHQKRAAVFDVSLDTDPERTLVAFVLQPAHKKMPNEKTRFNLLAATGILADASGQVEEE